MAESRGPAALRVGQAGAARVLTWLAAAAGCVAGASSRADTPVRARLEPAQAAFLAAHCTKCHDAAEANGGVRLDDLPLAIGDVATAERWAKVLGVLNSGEMPPEDEPRPPDDAKAAFLEVLSRQMVVARKALADSGGRITMRRLNRREYVNTIKDLLDVTVAPRDLPADDDNGSFDTIGSNLFFSSDQLEQYLALGRAALDEAIVTGPRPKPRTVRIELEEAANRNARTQLDDCEKQTAALAAWKASAKPPAEFGFADEGVAIRIERLVSGKEPGLRAMFAEPLSQTGLWVQRSSVFPATIFLGNVPPGAYVLRARLGFAADVDPRERLIEYGTQGEWGWPAEMKLLGWRQVTASVSEPEVVELPIVVTKAGSRFFGIREKRPNDRDTPDREHFRRIKERNSNTFLPTLWIDWMEWEGPLVETWPPKSHDLVFGDVDPNAKAGHDEARRVITRFAERAFRGQPVDPTFTDRLLERFADQVAAGEPFVEAIKTPLSIVLASPSFLYIAESGPVGATADGGSPKRELSEVELANRLAYFLWSSPPDDRLLGLAAEGRLDDATVLRAEVDRLLADERADRFIAGFTHQWLHMVRLDFFQFNSRLYPRFDGTVKEAARQEVYETLRLMLREDLPLGTLLKSDFVVVNQPLAEYYGIAGVQGPEFRRVAVPEGLPRGGLLGMAAILAMGSDGNRSSPVERGAWVLRKLLHDPPPPAPANVPQLSRFAGALMPARQLMTAHQEQPQCAQCHRKIDPIGYGLEHFDAAGGWRDEEYTEIWRANRVTKSQTFPIDATGTLPDGTPFDGFFGLRDAIATHEAAFARGLVEHLVEYALGRPCGFSDEDLVASILEAAAPRRFTPRALIQALVASPQFRSK